MGQKRVAIIGAGAAGLICARECVREGLDVQIFEKFPQSGGLWVLDEVPKDLQELNVCDDDYSAMASKVYSSIYDNLRTNTSRYVMGVSDFPFDEEYPGCKDSGLFPRHDGVLRYLDAFKKEYDLEKYITYETEVIEITRNESSDTEWDIKFQSNGKLKNSQFHVVAVCSGHFRVPCLPEFKKFEGFGRPCFHSHLYRNADQYKDKVVVILGNGSPGRDIVVDVAKQAKMVFFCARKWDKHYDLSKPFGARPNISLCTHISHCPAEGTVELVDGTLLTDVDKILFCTGYAYDFPFLKNSQLISSSELFVYPVYKHIFHTKHPTLGFIGLMRFAFQFITFEYQSKYFAKVVTGKCQLPDYETMMKEIDQQRQKVEGKNLDLRYLHDLRDDPFGYPNQLHSLCGASSALPSWRKDAFFFHSRLQKKEPILYRSMELPPEIVKRAKEDFYFVRKHKRRD